MIEVKHFTGLSVFTAQIIEYLQKKQIGDVITDEELEKVCGKNTSPNREGYGYLATALKYLEKQGKVFGRIREASAIKMLNSSEVVEVGGAMLKRTAKIAKRGIQKLETVNINSLSQEEKRRFCSYSAQMGALKLFSSKGTTKLLEVREVQTPIMSKDRMLEFFK